MASVYEGIPSRPNASMDISTDRPCDRYHKPLSLFPLCGQPVVKDVGTRASAHMTCGSSQLAAKLWLSKLSGCLAVRVHPCKFGPWQPNCLSELLQGNANAERDVLQA